MTSFVILATVLTLAGIAIVVVPLIRKHPAGYTAAPWTAAICAALLALGSVGLYAWLTNWSWAPKAGDDTPQTMVARLARKLEKNPDDLEGWLMLGRSYAVLQEYPLAVRAFERADRLAGGRSAPALIGEAEALVRGDENEFEGRAGKLIEQALKLDPNSGVALFYGAIGAMRRGELPLARERFTQLLALNPPDNVKPMLQRQIAAIDEQMSGRPGAPQPGAPQPGARDSAAAGPAAAGAQPAAAGTAQARIRIQVNVAPALAGSAQGSAPLFVFVRDPTRPGPPLAVKRLDSRFPQTVELTSADSMMAGRAIATGQKVQVVARIARSGSPVGASGDPFGEVAYTVGTDGVADVVINQVTP